jgi:hypothetical protein
MKQFHLSLRWRLLSAIAFLPMLLGAQPDLRPDSDFYNEQVPVFQRWLDQNKLPLHLQTLQIDTGLILLLTWPGMAPDSVPAAWRQLRADFRRSHEETLETRLFHRAANVFDIDKDHLAVQVSVQREGCFLFWLTYCEKGQIRTDTAACKGPKEDHIYIQPTDVTSLRKAEKTEIARRTNPQKVLSLAKTFLQNRYGTKTCALRTPRLLWLEDGPNSKYLEVEILNLCDEIVKEQQPATCRALQYWGYGCNWKKNEKLTIRLTYTRSGDGFALDLWLDGRYGSGFYENVGKRGYKDMGTDFDPELTEYAKILKNDLNKYLLSKL